MMISEIEKRNKETVSKCRPALAKLLDACDDGPFGELFDSPTRMKNLLMPTPAGGLCAVHDPDDPARDSIEYLDRIPADSPRMIIVLGFGLGYAVKTLHAERPNARALVIIEKDPRMLRAAMKHNDLSALLSDPRVHFFVGPKLDLVNGFVPANRELATIDAQVMLHAPAALYDPEFYNQAYAQVLSHVAGFAKMRSETVALGRVQFENRFRNAAIAYRSAPLTLARDRHDKNPAVIICSGAAAQENAGFLKDAAGRAVLIAVARALPDLLALGVVPDYVAAADPNADAVRHFRALPPARTALIAPITVSPKVAMTGSFSEILWVLTQNGADEILARLWAHQQDMRSGTDPIHHAVAAVGVFGCPQTLLCGTTSDIGPGSEPHGMLAHLVDQNTLVDFHVLPGVELRGARHQGAANDFTIPEGPRKAHRPVPVPKMADVAKRALVCLPEINKVIDLLNEADRLAEDIVRSCRPLIKIEQSGSKASFDRRLSVAMSNSTKLQKKIERQSYVMRAIYEPYAAEFAFAEQEKMSFAGIQNDPARVAESVLAYHNWVLLFDGIRKKGLSRLARNISSINEYCRLLPALEKAFGRKADDTTFAALAHHYVQHHDFNRLFELCDRQGLAASPRLAGFFKQLAQAAAGSAPVPKSAESDLTEYLAVYQEAIGPVQEGNGSRPVTQPMGTGGA